MPNTTFRQEYLEYRAAALADIGDGRELEVATKAFYCGGLAMTVLISGGIAAEEPKDAGGWMAAFCKARHLEFTEWYSEHLKALRDD